MILQALKEYYDRKQQIRIGYCPGRFRKKNYIFIVIDEMGEFINIEDTRERIGKRLIAKSFCYQDRKVEAALGVTKLLFCSGTILDIYLGYQ